MDEAQKIAAYERWNQEFIHRHAQQGYYRLSELPQRPSIAENAIGTGWVSFDEIFKFYPGQLVVVTGISSHGKSTFMFNLICSLARREGMSSFLYIPENEQHVTAKLRRIWNHDETFDELSQRIYLQSAVLSDPVEYKTLNWVLEKSITSIEKDGAGLVLIDPWNELEYAKPYDLSMTDHIGQSLMAVKEFARRYNVIVVIVAHPTKAVFDKAGKPRRPILADIEGSMNWFNKCDNGLVVYRSDEKPGITEIISAKVREHGAGKTGMREFRFDVGTGIFTPCAEGSSYDNL